MEITLTFLKWLVEAATDPATTSFAAGLGFGVLCGWIASHRATERVVMMRVADCSKRIEDHKGMLEDYKRRIEQLEAKLTLSENTIMQLNERLLSSVSKI